ncbi:hypothetical protein [Ornithinimicrobium cerasi]|uniref:sunset domain-containing protein n=1 Tax=Ornithinimicrobium cerasi TaxID=2248773 RepID=UPI000F0013EE|nr:hypothetical protein [Ornithinimicrobium cerasi]
MTDTTRWIMIILLLLLIGAAVFMLLRSPGKDDGEELRRGETDADRDGVADTDEVRGMDSGRPERGVYDQAAEDRAAGDRAAMEEAPQYAVDRPGDAVTVDESRLGATSEETYEPVVDERTDEHIDGPTPEESTYQPAAGAYDTDDSGHVDETSRPTTTDRPDETGAAQDGPPMRDAAAIGAAAAAGSAVAASHDRSEVAHEEPGHHDQERIGVDEAGYAADTTAYRDESAAYTGETGAEVHPLSDEDVEAGARTEPLTADEVVAADGSGYGDEVGTREDEYPVGDRETYRADEGDAVPVHDDTPTRVEDDTRDTAVSSAPAGGTYTQDPLVPTTADDTETSGATYAGTTAAAADRSAGDLPADTPAEREDVDTDPERERDATDDARTEDEGQGWDSAPAAGGGAAAAGTMFAESVYGPGSAQPLEDGSGPAGWEVKGNSGSMLFHTSDSPSYDAVRAEVWFENEDAARNAGFAHWDRRRR